LSGYDAERAKVFQQQLMTRLAALPGVKSVSLDREFNGNGIVTLLDQGGTGAKQYSEVPFEAIPAHISTRSVRRSFSDADSQRMR
jgi:hypothetical protein